MDALIVPLRNNNQQRFPYARLAVQQCNAVPCTMAGPLIPMLATQSLPFAGLAVQQRRAVHNCLCPPPSSVTIRSACSAAVTSCAQWQAQKCPCPPPSRAFQSLGSQSSIAEYCTLAGPLIPMPNTQQSLPVAELAVQQCHAVHNYRLISVSVQYWPFTGLAVQQRRTVHNCGPISASAHLPAELAIRWACSTAVPSSAQ